MAGFDAAAAVEPMDWNFEKFGGGSGTVPEPSNDEMKRFQRDFARVMREGAKLDMSDDAAKKMDETEFEAYQMKAEDIGKQLDTVIADLCKNSPSAEQVGRLPFRVKTAFSQWLMKQFNPEAEAAGTKS